MANRSETRTSGGTGNTSYESGQHSGQQFESHTGIRTHDARAVIDLLAERWPQCFSVYERRRRPLKLGIHHDVLAALGAAVTRDELKAALRHYVANPAYLRACRDGAIRIDLTGNAVGTVTADEAAYATARLAGRKPKPPAPIAKPNNGAATVAVASASMRRLTLDDLRAAAAERRQNKTPAAIGATGA